MKKKIFIIALLLLIGYVAYQAYIFFLAPTNNLQGIYLVPKDAVLVVETQKPIDNWEDISSSDIWKHLQTNTYFKDLTKSLNSIDGIFNKKKPLIDFIGNRSLLISVHVYKHKKYGLLYIADLQKISKLNLLKNHLDSFISDDYRINKRMYHQHTITEIYDKKSRETLYVSFIENQIIASYVHTLVENSIDQYQEPVIGRDLNFIEINKKVGYDKMFRVYAQYNYIDDYIKCFSDQPNKIIKDLSKSLVYSGFHFDLQRNNVMIADGYTNTNESTASYLKALQKSGKGHRTIAKVAPKRTALYLSYAFDSFAEFYKNFESIQKENPAKFKTYQDNLDKVENYLKINIKDNFISWVDDEIAFLQLPPVYTKGKNEMAIVLKVTNKNKAKTNLDFIVKQIKKKTPVKFKQVDYKNYQIQFMSIKGFFRLLLGNVFEKFDKPYFTIIDNYVIFSNHPNTLKSIIDNYVAKETLDKSEDFKDFNNYFDKKSSVFTYINTPILYDNLYALADKATKEQIKRNKDYIICFPQIGFQLTPYVNMFESKLVVSYQDPAVVKSKEQFKDKAPIGPSETANTKTETTNTNLISISTKDLFKVAPIYPNDLNAKEYISRFPNGSTHIKVGLKDGVRSGRYREYYPNGEIKLKGRFKEGKQVRTWRAYDSNGNFLEKKKF